MELTDKCSYCEHPAETWDHFVPLSRGGAHGMKNKVRCCKLCNGTKGNNRPEDFIAFMKFISDLGTDLHTLSKSQHKMLKYRFLKATGIEIGSSEELKTITLTREERLKAMEEINN